MIVAVATKMRMEMKYVAIKKMGFLPFPAGHMMKRLQYFAFLLATLYNLQL